MAHTGIGKRKSHHVRIILAVIAVLAVAYTWVNTT